MEIGYNSHLDRESGYYFDTEYFSITIPKSQDYNILIKKMKTLGFKEIDISFQEDFIEVSTCENVYGSFEESFKRLTSYFYLIKEYDKSGEYFVDKKKEKEKGNQRKLSIVDKVKKILKSKKRDC